MQHPGAVAWDLWILGINGCILGIVLSFSKNEGCKKRYRVESGDLSKDIVNLTSSLLAIYLLRLFLNPPIQLNINIYCLNAFCSGTEKKSSNEINSRNGKTLFKFLSFVISHLGGLITEYDPLEAMLYVILDAYAARSFLCSRAEQPKKHQRKDEKLFSPTIIIKNPL